MDQKTQLVIILSREHEELLLKITKVFTKFIANQHDTLLDPPFYIISTIYSLDRIVTDLIEKGQFSSSAPRQLISQLMKSLFETHISQNLHQRTDKMKEDLLLYKFCNMVDSCIHVLMMNDLDIDDEDIVTPESVSICCFPHKIVPVSKRDSLHRINPNYFIHCNYIHNHLHSYFKKYYSIPLENAKLDRIMEKFPILKQLKNRNLEDIFISFYRVSGVYLQNITMKEYNWLNRVIYISEYLPISISISRLQSCKEFPIVYVNREFENISGYKYDEIVGKSYYVLHPKQPVPNETLQNKILRNCINNAVPVSVIVTNEKKNGRPFYNLLAVNPVCDKDGNYLYVISIQTTIIRVEQGQSDSIPFCEANVETSGNDRINIRNIQSVIDLLYVFSNCNIDKDVRIGSTLRC